MDSVEFDCYLVQQVDFGSGGHQLSFVTLSYSSWLGRTFAN